MSVNNNFNINVNYSHLFTDSETDNVEEAAISDVIEEELTEQVKDRLLNVKPDLTIEGHVNRLLEQLDMKLTLADQIDALEDELDELKEEISEAKEELKNLKNNKKSLQIQNITLIQEQEGKIRIVRAALKQMESNLRELEIKEERLQESNVAYTAAMQDQEAALLGTINAEIGCGVLDREDLPLLLSHDGIVPYLVSGEDQPEKLAHVKTMMISILENRKSFLIEKKAFLESQKDFLFQEFGHMERAPVDVEMNLKPLGGDAHHGGASPILVTFSQNGETCLKLVYKPRIVETDKAIMDLFDELNQLLESEHFLPVYKILDQGREGSFWHNSVWDYIEGVEPGTSSNAHELIHSLKMGAHAEMKKLTQLEIEDPAAFECERKKLKVLEIFEKNLAWLEAVCKYAGITDLHGENIRLTGIKTDICKKRIIELEENGDLTEGKQFQVIPIDLEVVKMEDYTGLFGKKDSLQPVMLSDREKEVIDRFIEAQKGRISRLVPISTTKFVECMLDYQEIKALPELVYQELKIKYNCDIILNKEAFKELIMNCISRGDIPYFTKQGENIYYGLLEILIAKIKE